MGHREHYGQLLQHYLRPTITDIQCQKDTNGVAHNCAHQALRQFLTQPIFCLSLAHSSIGCPTIAVLQNSTSQDYVIHDVLCN
jgi:hypothetical protein